MVKQAQRQTLVRVVGARRTPARLEHMGRSKRRGLGLRRRRSRQWHTGCSTQQPSLRTLDVGESRPPEDVERPLSIPVTGLGDAFAVTREGIRPGPECAPAFRLAAEVWAGVSSWACRASTWSADCEFLLVGSPSASRGFRNSCGALHTAFKDLHTGVHTWPKIPRALRLRLAIMLPRLSETVPGRHDKQPSADPILLARQDRYTGVRTAHDQACSGCNPRYARQPPDP